MEIPQGFSLPLDDLRHIERGFHAWDKLRARHLFITGGTGFFGVWLTEALLWANQRLDLGLTLTILSRDPQQFLKKRGQHLALHSALTLQQGSVADFEPPDRPCSYILHLATSSGSRTPVDLMSGHLDTATRGMKRILQMARAHASEGLLLTSSGAIYAQPDTRNNGQWCEGPGAVDDFLAEKSVYGLGKRLMETLAALEAKESGLRVSIARCFAFAGPYLPLDGGYAVGNFVRDVIAGQDIVIESDGSSIRSYLYAGDLVIWLLTILVSGESCRPYNVGSDQPITIAELAERISKLDKSGRKVVIRKHAQEKLQSIYVPDIARAHNELGLRVTIDLDESLRRMLEWYRAREQPREEHAVERSQ